MTTKQEFLFDKRVAERNIERGLLDAKVYEKSIASLPDRADNVALTSYDDEAADELADASNDETE